MTEIANLIQACTHHSFLCCGGFETKLIPIRVLEGIEGVIHTTVYFCKPRNNLPVETAYRLCFTFLCNVVLYLINTVNGLNPGVIS